MSACPWEDPSTRAQARVTKGEMLGQKWKGLRWGVKRQLQRCSTCWTMEAEEARIYSARVTGIGGGEETEG